LLLAFEESGPGNMNVSSKLAITAAANQAREANGTGQSGRPTGSGVTSERTHRLAS
jgi:hypothetical protein